MAKIYARQIKRGAISIEDVPEMWRGEVEKLLTEHTGSSE